MIQSLCFIENDSSFDFSSLMPETNKRPLMQTTNEAIKFYSESKR